MKDQNNVAEILAGYFASIADGIGGKSAELLSEKDFSCHPSVLRIAKESRKESRKESKNEEVFEFQPVNKAQVQSTLELLNTRKATGCDSIPIKALKVQKNLPLHSLPYTILVLEMENGRMNGKPVNGCLSSRKKIPRKKKMTVQ